MILKALFTAALLCHVHGLYIQQSTVSVVTELKPQIEELKTLIENYATKSEQKIQTVTKDINMKITMTNLDMNAHYFKISSVVQQSKKLHKNIDMCVTAQQNQESAVKNANINRFDLIKDQINWNFYNSQVTAIKNMVFTVTTIPATCVGQSKLDAALTRECMMLATETQAQNALNHMEYISSSMDMAKQTVYKAIADSKADLVSIIENIIEDFNACVEENSVSFEDITKEFEVQIKEMKSDVRNSIENLITAMTATHGIIKNAISSAEASITTQITGLAAQETSTDVSGCNKERTIALNNLNMQSLQICKRSKDIDAINMATPPLVRYEVQIGKVPTTCASECQEEPKLFKQCIEEKLHLIRVEMQKQTSEINSAIMKVKNDQVECVETTKKNIISDLEQIIVEYNSCLEESSKTVEEIIDELKNEVNAQKESIRNTKNEILNLISTTNSDISTVISNSLNVVSEKLGVLSNSLNEISTDNKCVMEKNNNLELLNFETALNQCRVSGQLQSISEIMVQISKIEAAFGGMTGNCVNIMNGKPIEVKQCIKDAINEADSYIKLFARNAVSLATNARNEVKTCSITKRDTILTQIETSYKDFDLCLETAAIEKVVDNMKVKINSQQETNRNTRTEISKLISTTENDIASVISKAINLVNNEISQSTNYDNDKVVVNDYTSACITELHLSLPNIDNEFNGCKTSPQLDSITKKINEISKSEAILGGISGFCVSMTNRNPTAIEKCIEAYIQEADDLVKSISQSAVLLANDARKEATVCTTSIKNNLFTQIEKVVVTYDECVADSSKSIEQVIDELNDSINMQKKNIQTTKYELIKLVGTTQDDIGSIVNKASILINNKLSTLTSTNEHTVSNNFINVCFTEQNLSVQLLNIDTTINNCRGSLNIETLNEKITAITKIEAIMGNIAGTCVSKTDGNPRTIKRCIQDTVRDADDFVSTTAKSIVSLSNDARKEASTCTTSNKDSILSKIEKISSNFDVCLVESSMTIEEVIDELENAVNTQKEVTIVIKNNILQLISINQNEISNTINKALSTIYDELNSATPLIGTLVIDTNMNACMSEQRSLVQLLEIESSLNDCRVDQNIGLISQNVATVTKLESVFVNIFGECVSKSGGNPRIVRRCVNDTLKDADSFVKEVGSISVLLANDARKHVSTCTVNKSEQILNELKAITLNFNNCIKETVDQ